MNLSMINSDLFQTLIFGFLAVMTVLPAVLVVTVRSPTSACCSR